VIKKLMLLLLLMFLAAASAGAILIFAWYRQWPPQLALLGPAIFLGLPLLWGLIRLAAGGIARRRYSKKTGAPHKEAPRARGRDFSILRQEWQRGLIGLRGRGGSPLEGKGALPLFLAAGPDRSGMTMALGESGLAVSQADQPGARVPGEGCDWYFFEKAVYVAVQGLFSRPEGEALAAPVQGGAVFPGQAPAASSPRGDPEKERSALMELLAGMRSRIPLQGFLAIVPSRLLRPEREKELQAYGLETWSLLNRLSGELDFSAPVYVLVTLLDDDPGWAALMERKERGGEPLGYAAPAARRPLSGAAFAGRAAEAMKGQLLGLLDDLLEEEPEAIGPCLTALASAGGLRRPLAVFCEAVASPSPASPPQRIQGVFAARIPRNGAGGAEDDPAAEKMDAGLWAEEAAPAGPVPSPARLSPAGAAAPPPAPRLAAESPEFPGGNGPGDLDVARLSGLAQDGPSPGAARGARREAEAGKASARDSGAFRPRGLFRRRRGRAPLARDGEAKGLREILGTVIPRGARLARPLNFAWSGRQKGLVAGLGLFYLALLAAAALASLNVSYHKGLWEAMEDELRSSERMDGSEGLGGGTSLAGAYRSLRLLTRLEFYEKSRRFRGIGPDRATGFKERLNERFRESVERTISDLGQALSAQLDRALPGGGIMPRAAAGGFPPGSRAFGTAPTAAGAGAGAAAGGRHRRQGAQARGEGGAGPAEENAGEEGDWAMFSFTFRQLQWFHSYWQNFSSGDGGPAAAFPALPQGFQGETAPYWNIGLTRLLYYYLSKEQGRDRAQIASGHFRGRLALAVARAAASQSGKGLDWLVKWCDALPETGQEDLETFWRRYDAAVEVKEAVPEGASLAVPAAYTKRGHEEILDAIDMLKDSLAGAAEAAARPGATAEERSDVQALAEALRLERSFLEGYEREFQEAWRSYKASFEAVARGIYDTVTVAGLDGQHNVGGISPYVRFAELLYDNLSGFAWKEEAEPWLLNIALDRYVAMWRQEKSGGGIRSLLAHPTASGQAEDISAWLTAAGGRAEFMEKVYAAEAAYSRYLDETALILEDLKQEPDDVLFLAGRYFGGPTASVGRASLVPGAAGSGPSGAARPKSAGAKAAGAGAKAAAAVAKAGAAFAPKAAADASGGGQAPSDSSHYAQARQSIETFRRCLFQEPDGEPPDDLFYAVRLMTLDSMERLLVESAAAALDAHWSTEVAEKLQFMSNAQARQGLYGENGLLAAFLSEWAGPFMEDKCAGACKARTWRGIAFPFTDDFLRMAAAVKGKPAAGAAAGEPAAAGGLAGASPEAAGAYGAGPGGGIGGPGSSGAAADDSAALQGSYPVTVSIVSTETDPGALEKPLRTSLTVSSQGEVQSLVNYNYPVSARFDWKPGVPAAVAIEIQFPSLSLYVNYEGPEGFPDFVSDVASGGFTLAPKDFPLHEGALSALGVTFINVRISADGALPAVHALRLTRTPIPESIVKAVLPTPMPPPLRAGEGKGQGKPRGKGKSDEEGPRSGK
jgi:hypothetical protein